MCKSRSDINQPKTPDTEFQANWIFGPRTAVWDNLWRRILSDVLTNHETPNYGEDVQEVDIDA